MSILSQQKYQRQRMVKYAQKHSVTETAIRYRVSRKTVYKWISRYDGCRTDFADIQNKKECGGNRQWQNHYLRNWAANTKGKGII